MNKNSQKNINYWYSKNKNALDYLFSDLINISKTYGIIIKENNESYNNYIKMMYYESNKEIIDKTLYPELFKKKMLNNDILDKYVILN